MPVRTRAQLRERQHSPEQGRSSPSLFQSFLCTLLLFYFSIFLFSVYFSSSMIMYCFCSFHSCFLLNTLSFACFRLISLSLRLYIFDSSSHFYLSHYLSLCANVLQRFLPVHLFSIFAFLESSKLSFLKFFSSFDPVFFIYLFSVYLNSRHLFANFVIFNPWMSIFYSIPVPIDLLCVFGYSLLFCIVPFLLCTYSFSIFLFSVYFYQSIHIWWFSYISVFARYILVSCSFPIFNAHFCFLIFRDTSCSFMYLDYVSPPLAFLSSKEEYFARAQMRLSL